MGTVSAGDPLDERVEGYGVVVAPPRRDLQALVELAAEICGVPTAAINMVTATEQHQIATAGFEPSICARADSMCAAVLEDAGTVMVADARSDDRFRTNPFVDGTLGDVRFYASAPLVTPEGTVLGRLCVFDSEPREITARQREVLTQLAQRVVDVLELGRRTRQLEQTVAELTTARNELRRSNRLLALFAGQISHDLRTPLTAILANTEMLALEPQVAQDENLSELVDATLQSGRRMSTLIREILAHARVGAELKRTSVDLASLVEMVLEDLGPQVHERDARIEVGPLPTVTGDVHQLYGVFLNLLSNALKFTRPGTAPQVEVTATRRDDGWRVSVTDHGAGIPAEAVEEVFTLHAQARPSLGGSGIGLATARRVVEAHGGTIGADVSTPGRTTVWFDLPD
ncbi:GAF domain-containing sensor histidine kinase [Actinotalea sp. K2]|uniref:sensor histidine kinase n=1 Tax=Actinotalea sp. K2 TaxID=2939438 RepID=UPI002016ED05|nr:GAF domain-containing sensor histidine kinase [Actinotalea sp. K2]MCL3860366.1 GAF domain-containing sensor histidine kinase [Actinotalea sp. K2]